MISLPANPPVEANTVEAVLGDDISPLDYEDKWVLYAYDAITNEYTQLKLESHLEQGLGYWITQETGEAVTLDLPAGSVDTPNGYSIQLVSSQNGAGQWNLLGYPFSRAGKLGDFVVQSTGEACNNPVCDINQAKVEGLFHDQVWTWANQAYSTIEKNDSLTPWDGFWSTTLENSFGQSLVLKHMATSLPDGRGITNNDPGKFEGSEPQNIIDAVTGNKQDIEDAIRNASVGDTVRIPEGTWEISGSTIEVPEGISLMGVRSGGEIKTILKRQVEGYTYPPMLRYSAIPDGSSKPFKVSNIRFVGVGSELNSTIDTEDIIDSGLELSGALKDFIIVNNEFTGFTVGVHFYPNAGSRKGFPVGVIAKNKFEDIFFLKKGGLATGYGVSVAGPCLGKDTDHPSCQEWDGLFKPGTNNAVFIEDNYFTKTRHAVAGHSGGRYVFRYNEIKDNIYPYAAIDAHGERVDQDPLSTRSYEIYHNLIQGGVTRPNGDGRVEKITTWAMGIRGGGGVIFNNDIVRDSSNHLNYEKAFLLLIERNRPWILENMASGVYPDILGKVDQLFFWGNRFKPSSDGLIAIESLPKEQREKYFTFGTIIRAGHIIEDEQYRDFVKHYIEGSVHYKKPAAGDWTPGYDYQPFSYPHPLRNPG
ncbi:MAG: hypothetical protein L3J59_13110 [Methylococcaceae bacterium]|nr:hypothetical protein [Methylococcaceae bacterium]